MPIRETLLRTRDLTVATTKATTAASESRCEGDADDDRMRGEGVNVVNLTSYPQRAKARWNLGAP
jgi:hypothetical protein